MPHNKTLEEVKQEVPEQCYWTYIDYVDDIPIFYEFLKNSKNEKFVKIWSFGENKNFITETLPIIYAGEAKKAIIQKIKDK